MHVFYILLVHLKVITLTCIFLLKACASPPTSTPIPTQTIHVVQGTPPPISLTSSILDSGEINGSKWVQVDDGLVISDRGDCLPKDCAFSVWKVLHAETLGFTIDNLSLELVISLHSFQTPVDADAQAEITAKQYAGQPGKQWVEIPANILPEHSVAYAEDGRYVVLITVDKSTVIVVSFSSFNWGIDEPEKAGGLLANLAKVQIDKLRLSGRH